MGGSPGRRESRCRPGRVYPGQRRAGGSVWDPVGDIRTRDSPEDWLRELFSGQSGSVLPWCRSQAPLSGWRPCHHQGSDASFGSTQEGGTDHGRQAEHCRSPLLGDGLPGDSLHGNPEACCGGGVSIQADVIRAHEDPQVPIRRRADLRCAVPGSGKVLPPNSTSRRKARKGRDAARRHEANGVAGGGDSPG